MVGSMVGRMVAVMEYKWDILGVDMIGGIIEVLLFLEMGLGSRIKAKGSILGMLGGVRIGDLVGFLERKIEVAVGIWEIMLAKILVN